VHVIDIPLAQYKIFITNVVEFILQVTRVLYFSQCNPQVRFIKWLMVN